MKYVLLVLLMVFVGCSRPSTVLDSVALSYAVKGDHKIASEFAWCESQFNKHQCKADAIARRNK